MSLASWDTVHTYKQRHVGSSPRSHHLASTVYTPDFHLFYIFQPEWSDWQSMGVLGVHFHRLWTSSSTFIGPKELCAILSSSQVFRNESSGNGPSSSKSKVLLFDQWWWWWGRLMRMRNGDADVNATVIVNLKVKQQWEAKGFLLNFWKEENKYWWNISPIRRLAFLG